LLWSASYPCLVQAQSVPPGCDTRLPHAFLGPKSGFPRLSSLSASSLATSRFPWLFVSFLHLLPDSLRPCESGRVLGLHATPVRFRLDQRPLVVIPGFCILAGTRFRGCFVFVLGGRALRMAFATFRHVGFTLRIPDVLQTSRHDFLFAGPASSDRALGMRATPVSCGETEPPGRPFRARNPAATSHC